MREALGRFRGGYGTKTCVIADGRGRAVAFALAPGQAHELPMASGLLGCLPDVPTWVVGDRGFASDAFRERIWAMGARPAIPPRRTDAEVACPDWIYANHRLVENLWTRLKEWRAIAIHYEKTASMDASSPSWSGSASTTLWHLDAAEQGASTPSGERALKLVGRSMHMAN